MKKLSTAFFVFLIAMDCHAQNNEAMYNFEPDERVFTAECEAYALNLDNTSTFKWICDTCNTDLKNSFIGLDTLYREFYRNADVKSLWSKYKRRPVV